MFFNFKKPVSSISMKEAERELASDKSIYLLDVRTGEEFASGHIPGSINLPLDRIAGVVQAIPEKDARIFVYCHSGARSFQACMMMERLGYTDVTNIGGIMQWRGKLERKVGA